jgi:hypothetical protein
VGNSGPGQYEGNLCLVLLLNIEIRFQGLFDSDGDFVALSDSIPNDQLFTVREYKI